MQHNAGASEGSPALRVLFRPPWGRMGSPPQGLHVSPCCCPVPGAQPRSSTHQHPPAHGGLGLPAPCPGCLLTSWTCSPMASSFWDCPKSAISSGGQGAETAVSRCWALGGLQGEPHTLLTPERGSQHQALPPALQLRAAVSTWHVSPFQLALPGHRVTQPFCTQEKHCQPPRSRGSMEQRGPRPSRHQG